MTSGIGLENVQISSLKNGSMIKIVILLMSRCFRVDELAKLGYCYFCSILYIANEPSISANSDEMNKFMAVDRYGGNNLVEKHGKNTRAFL